MDEKTIHAFKAISNLLTDLRTVFRNDKPLALYERLVQKTPFLNVEAIKRHIHIFTVFVNSYKTDIMYDKDLPEDVTIEYTSNDDVATPSNINIAIGRFMKKAPAREKSLIRNHLLTICAIISPDDKILDTIESLEEKLNSLNIDTSTRSGEFIHNILTQAKEATEGVNVNTPADAISAIMGSGLLQKMISGIGQQVGEGGIDPQDLLSTMIGSLSSLTGEGNSNKNTPRADRTTVKELPDVD